MKNLDTASLSTRKVGINLPAIGLRISVLLLFVMLLIPSLNPARISEKINRNMSLFTSGFFHDSLVAEMGRYFTKGWMQESTMWLVFFASLVACIGIFASVAGACMSLGNNKLRRIGNLVSIGGALLVLLGMGGLYMAHDQLVNAGNLEYSKPMDPVGLQVVVVVAVVTLLFALLSLLTTPAPVAGEKAKMEAPKRLFLMLLPFVILTFVFAYLPLWGWRFAFFNYSPGDNLTADNFVGFTWFTYLFQNEATVRDLVRVVLNTLAMSGLGILTSWCPIMFAVFLSEIRSTRARRIIQTLTTIPNFISWVLVYAVAVCIFSTDGFISSLLVNAGVWQSGQNMLMGGDNVWPTMLLWGMWKGLGWGAIMYIAAISSIDQEQYEAATVDGAGRFQRMWHITLPALIPTYMVMLLLQIAGILNNGVEQYLVFENSSNTSAITNLDLYVYKLGIGKGAIPLSTVVGMAKSIISVLLLFGANGLSKVIRGKTIV